MCTQVGIDFDLPYFHYGFLFLTNTSVNVRVAMQATHRIRQLIENKVFILLHRAFGKYTRFPSLSAVQGDLEHTRNTVRRLLRRSILVPENPTPAELSLIEQAASSESLDHHANALLGLMAYNELETRMHKRHFVRLVRESLTYAGYNIVEEELAQPGLPKVRLAEVNLRVAYQEISMPTETEWRKLKQAITGRKASAEDKLRASKYEFTNITLEACDAKSDELPALYEGFAKPADKTRLLVTVAYKRYHTATLANDVIASQSWRAATSASSPLGCASSSCSLCWVWLARTTRRQWCSALTWRPGVTSS